MRSWGQVSILIPSRARATKTCCRGFRQACDRTPASRCTSSTTPPVASSCSRLGRRTEQPVHFYGTAQIRVGSSKTALRQPPGEGARDLDAGQRLVGRSVARRRRSTTLDPEAITKAREQFVVKHPGAGRTTWLAGTIATFLNKARVLRQGAGDEHRHPAARSRRVGDAAIAGGRQDLLDPQGRGEPRAGLRAHRPTVPARRRSPAEADSQPHRARSAERDALSSGNQRSTTHGSSARPCTTQSRIRTTAVTGASSSSSSPTGCSSATSATSCRATSRR